MDEPLELPWGEYRETTHAGASGEILVYFSDLKVVVYIATIWRWGVRAMAVDGLITVRSSFGPADTMARLEADMRARGLTVFAHIDHGAGAAQVGLALRPTDLLIFGNAKGGTPLMQVAQTSGIDLPLKALVWQDESGTTWLSYDDPAWIAERHGLGRSVDASVHALTTALGAIAKAATAAA